LTREMVPHRHNPEDLVPVIKLANQDMAGTLHQIPGVTQEDVEKMIRRIIVSVEQFTSFRGFAWCPLGSLHRRLRPYDPSTSFQQAVEELIEAGAVKVDEYENPQSEYRTKGISLVEDAPRVYAVLADRNEVIRVLLELYEQRIPITREALLDRLSMDEDEIDLWLSIMQSENVLKPVPGQPNVYSLFRTHHTVMQVAGDAPAH